MNESTSEDQASLPEIVLCPICHAVFAPTPELLALRDCPACREEFEDEDEWEEPEDLSCVKKEAL